MIDLINAQPRPTLLLVDDTPTNIDILVGLLKGTYNLKVATRGAAALKICKADPASIDLILLDVMMPEMDGYEVCQRLRAQPGTKDTPVIFLTAKTGLDDVVRGFEVGANDYVTKPFRPPELRARVRTQLEILRQRREIAAKNIELHSLVHLLCHDVANKFAVLKLVLELIDVRPELDIRQFLPRIRLAVDCGVGLTTLVRQFEAAEEKGLKLCSVPLASAVADIAVLESDRLKAKDLVLETAVEDVSVVAEPWSLRNSVIENLVSNAIKFSPRGGIIRVASRIDGDQVVLSVRDQGIGIPADLLPALFEVTKSTSREGTEGERGTGFGMPLVRRCVTLYGGRIDVESRSQDSHPEDHGTEFHVRLKRA